LSTSLGGSLSVRHVVNPKLGDKNFVPG